MVVTCSICDKTYTDKYSLRAHISRYHKNKHNSKVSNTTIDDNNAQNMEYRLDNNLFKNSVIQNESYSKDSAYKDDSSQNEIIFQNNKLLPYIERLPKLFRITTDLLNDIKYLKKVVKQKQNIPSFNRIISKMKYIERLPKLFKITGNVLNDVKDLEKDVNEIQSENIASNVKMSGSGIENKNKINELNNDINHLFIKIMELEDSVENKSIGFEYLEKIFDNTLLIVELFRNNMYSDIKYKIKELRNAALLTLKILNGTKLLDKDNEKLLHSLVNGSIFDGKELLEKNIKSLDTIFSYLPSEEDFIEVVKELKGSKNIDDDVENNNSSEDFVANTSKDYDPSECSESEKEDNESEEVDEEELKEEIVLNSDIEEEMMDTDKKSIEESEGEFSDNIDNQSKSIDNDDEMSENEKSEDIPEEEEMSVNKDS